jgi:SNF2 family DNA or RNA helicase
MNLRTSLFEWQQPAVAKLLPTRVGGLFMDMGTGKTRCAIELIARRRSRIDRVVWFCPVTLKETIYGELLKHTDLLESAICVFDEHTTQRNVVSDALVYVAGLESLGQSDRVTLAANALITDRSYVVVDESSYIKGHCAKRTQRVTAMAERAKYRLILTGTPLSQGVVDLFSQMRFLSPAILGYHSFYSFAANHLEYSDRYPGMIVRAHNTEHLAAKIAPYVYQVTKDECLTLPDKLHDVAYYSLTDEQRAAYWEAKETFLPLVDDNPYRSSYVIFQLFTALQEIVSGFWQRKGGLEEYPHHRLDVLADRIAAIPDEAKVIIWARFQYSVRQIVAALTAEHGAEVVAQHHGEIDERERTAELARWQHGPARFLVATQATGGHGLTLTEGHYAVFYENGFKYAERIQAEDRIHRIGQGQRCTYIDLVATRSIDERIQRALSDKADVVESFRQRVQAVRAKKDQQALKALVMEL